MIVLNAVLGVYSQPLIFLHLIVRGIKMSEFIHGAKRQSPFTFRSPFQALYVAALGRSPAEAKELSRFVGDTLVKMTHTDLGAMTQELLSAVSQAFHLSVKQDQQTRLWQWIDEYPSTTNATEAETPTLH